MAYKVLLAGATGYLGSYILKELLKNKFESRVIVRKKNDFLNSLGESKALETFQAELTQPGAIINCCEGVDTVISTVGITKQKDGLTYMDVDYQANMNLLKEAKRSGVRRFIYVSVFRGNELTHLKICAAKEQFVAALKNSGLDYCIIRPTGYFSDMGEFYEMAKKGRVFLFGNGAFRMNPIHGADLAKICCDAIQTTEKEIPIGGQEVLSFNQIAEIACSVAGKKTRITHIPDWIRKSILALLRTFTGSKTYGPIEFFMTVLSMDLMAPASGSHTLKAYFEELKSKG
ncbi:MAG: SDR family oxidoreductase [Bacteroidetes bacterium]|nr:SDR family oxidoreductase [Bacteroidota bacterium]